MATVTDPAGRLWTGRRRWHQRDREAGPGGWAREALHGGWEVSDALGWAGEIPVIGIVFAVAAIVAFLALVVVPLLVLVLDLLVLVLIAAASLLGRVLFRRPWTIEATTGDTLHRWDVVGWRASGDQARLIREQLELGMPLPEQHPPTP